MTLVINRQHKTRLAQNRKYRYPSEKPVGKVLGNGTVMLSYRTAPRSH